MPKGSIVGNLAFSVWTSMTGTCWIHVELGVVDVSWGCDLIAQPSPLRVGTCDR